ncbi:MAG TPA: Stk1 family PASTA domain-containing Ser/Thr kinase [Candidatus Baltobacteraceae bacterium]
MIEEQVFNGRYRLEKKLGEGGMATVYCGTDSVLRRRVAVKVLREQYAADEEFVRRFYQEAESAARLSHPNIVNTYDVGREDNLYYIVMELIDGPSLAEIIGADGRLPEPVAIDYAAQICNGLAYAHRQGLLHRDVKPANILVTKDDVVKLSDFGIARAVSTQTMALTKPGLVMGSVYYISPEQAQSHELHESSDLYSVGVVLYQMLTGQLPFTGESPVTVALKHISDPVPSIDTSALGVSPALAAIVNKLLQKQPEHRFQSAAEVGSALREARERPSVAAWSIADDAPTQRFAAVTPPPRRSPQPDRSYAEVEDRPRRRVGSGAVAAVVALLLIATVGGYLLFGRALAHFGPTVALSDYRNQTDTDAVRALDNAGLLHKIVFTASDTIPAHRVISQNPAVGIAVDPGSTVELFVSNGLPVVGLRDVTGFTFTDAQAVLTGDKFVVKVKYVHNALSKNTVISQKPKARSNVRQGSTVLLDVSLGPAQIALPKLVGLTVAAAQALAGKDGFTLDASQSASFAGVPAGTIGSQDTPAGTLIDPKAPPTVAVVVSSGQPAVSAQSTPAAAANSLPDLTGESYADALAAIAAVHATVQWNYRIQSTGHGTVVAQVVDGDSPALTLAVSGEVPDTVGESIDQARMTLAADGYPDPQITYTTIEGSNGNVARTDPMAGTTLQPGTSVTLVVNGSGQ